MTKVAKSGNKVVERIINSKKTLTVSKAPIAILMTVVSLEKIKALALNTAVKINEVQIPSREVMQSYQIVSGNKTSRTSKDEFLELSLFPAVIQ